MATNMMTDRPDQVAIIVINKTSTCRKAVLITLKNPHGKVVELGGQARVDHPIEPPGREYITPPDIDIASRQAPR